ncbi:protease modulator HflC [Citreimonas salinaria]|uniref:Protease FtsH subunit HflC n=1 Tax=Citreimonas salinaria TaxID=321339 RepID=A0A1H3H8X4_9RHOB|nr:protease modulator HflC [Citreimonas salinaria]SDY11820.1 protease FtsH subunit HflC [Citreimonas salinaria]
MRKGIVILVVAIVALVVILSSVFVVDEREKALVLQFGQIRDVKEEPGLAFKVPIIQDVVRYDDRILSLDTETIEVTPADDRRLVVDAFARYRIADVVQFRQAVGVGGVATAEDRLSSILNAQIREVLGADQVTSDRILSEERGALMIRIRDQARAQARSLGLDVVDVRLKQTNLPVQNLEATFARMRAEREREAADEIARGNEAAQRVRALADRTVTETISEAEREGQIVRGEADAERSRIYATAFGADPEFFAFYRSLEAYESALQGENSTMVMTPDSQFFEYFRNENAGSPLTVPEDQPQPINEAGIELESDMVPDRSNPVAPRVEDLEEMDDGAGGPARLGAPDAGPQAGFEDVDPLPEDEDGDPAPLGGEAFEDEGAGDAPPPLETN